MEGPNERPFVGRLAFSTQVCFVIWRRKRQEIKRKKPVKERPRPRKYLKRRSNGRSVVQSIKGLVGMYFLCPLPFS